MEKHLVARQASAIAATALLATLGWSGSAFAANTPAPKPSSSSTVLTGNAIDIAFAQMMIPHHQQASQMAFLALRFSKSPQVLALARKINAAQQPEIATMKQWLKTWGAPMAVGSTSSMSHMGGGSTTDGQVIELARLRGKRFDTLFVQMMIAHHQGAITEARRVVKATRNSEVRKLAQAVITGQSAEIINMKEMLGK